VIKVSFRGVLTENLGLKLTALVLALLLEWYFYSPDNSVLAELHIPVRLEQLPPSRMIVWPPNAERLNVRLKVRGPGPLVDKVRSGNYAFVVDLSNTRNENNKTIILNERELQLPSGVSLVDIEPEKIDLRLDTLVEKELLVVAQSTGHPVLGYVVHEMHVKPETVIARGPQSELEGLNIVETTRIDVTGLTETRQFHAPLVRKGVLTKYTDDIVSVEVMVSAIPAEKVLENVPVFINGAGIAATIEPSRIKRIRLGGPQSVLENLTADGIRLYVDAVSLQAGKHRVKLAAELPPKVMIVEAVPNEVEVIIAGAREGRAGRKATLDAERPEKPESGSEKSKGE
jgi:YbbR domain-containing protein